MKQKLQTYFIVSFSVSKAEVTWKIRRYVGTKTRNVQGHVWHGRAREAWKERKTRGHAEVA